MSSTNSDLPHKPNSFFDRLTEKILPDRHYRNQYLDFLGYQHRNFDVKGLTTRGTFTLELSQVFVDLSLGPQIRHRASTDPIRPMSREGVKERLDLWEHLTERATKKQNLALLGPPGSGKTTLLKHVTLALAARKAAPELAKRLNKLPIMLFLRDHAEAIKGDPNYSLESAVKSRLAYWDIELPVNWLTSQLQKGQCLVMLDGLDEVADPILRQQTAAWVDRQMTLYKGNRFLITSRPFGYRNNPLQNVTVLEVRPFTIEQVQRFVHNWYLANEIMGAQRDDPGVRMDAHKGAEDLLWRLRQTHVLLEMAVNPLLLTMIATVHRYRSSLPGRRVELYAEIAEVFLGKRQQARGITYELTPAQKQRVLEEMAYYMMRQRKREIPEAEAVQAIKKSVRRVMGAEEADQPQAIESFLKMIENTSGLLVEREAGLYGFAHLTFQEYMAAVHVRDKKLERELVRHVEDGWWHETIRLYAAQADATNIVKACLTRKKPSVVALTLAMECLDEAREVRPELRTIFDKLAQSVDHERADVRHLAAEVLLALRLRRMVRVDETKYIDSSFVTHAEYQIFLDEESVFANYFLPDHWAGGQFPVGQGRAPIVGMRPSDALAFCNWLTRREAGGWRYRLPNAAEQDSISRQRQARGDTDEPVGYWFIESQGYKCTRFEFTDSALTETMRRHMEQRVAFDWALENRMEQANAALKQASDLIVGRARQRRFMLYDFDREPPPALRQRPQLMQDLGRARDRVTAAQARHLDRVLSDAVARAESLDVMRAQDIDLDGVADLVATLRHDLDQASDLGTGAEIGRQIGRNFEYALNLTQNRNVVMNPELVRALSNTRRFARQAGESLEKAVVRARARVRAQMLAYIVELIHQASLEAADGRSQALEQNKRRLLAFIDLYLDFALLEERISQNLGAFEGILLIREQG